MYETVSFGTNLNRQTTPVLTRRRRAWLFVRRLRTVFLQAILLLARDQARTRTVIENAARLEEETLTVLRTTSLFTYLHFFFPHVRAAELCLCRVRRF